MKDLNSNKTVSLGLLQFACSMMEIYFNLCCDALQWMSPRMVISIIQNWIRVVSVVFASHQNTRIEVCNVSRIETFFALTDISAGQ